MKSRIALFVALLHLSSVVSAGDIPTLVVEPAGTLQDKIVELEILFAPPPTAEIKKQRKTFATRSGRALCTGLFVSSYGHILTAKHCVEGATEIGVMTADRQEYVASSRAMSTTQDLAVIQIGRSNTPYFKLAKSITQGEKVQILGSPLGLTYTLTEGIVAKLKGDVILLDCTALPGNSGGPVINAKGELVGVLSAIIIVILGPSHLSVAQSADSVRLFFYELSGGK